MKFIILTLFLFTLHGDFNKIAEINRLKKEAQQAYIGKNYKEAAAKYRILVDSLGQDNDELLMNLAHCYFNLQDTTQAINHYKQLTRSENKSFESVAWQQLGILDAESQQFGEAEEDFKNALRANPSNEDARYNYELLKKKLKNQEQKNKNNQNKDQKQNKDQQQKDQQQQNQQKQNQQQQQKQQQQQDQKNQEKNKDQQQDQQQKQEQGKQQQDQENKKKDEEQNQQEAQQKNDQQKDNKENSQQMSKEKFDENKISREKARMILEAMKNTEEQYLQQLKRKSAKKPDSDKPDW